jgi:cytochrome c biogenesis protein CcdA
MSAVYVLLAGGIGGGILKMPFVSGVLPELIRPFLAPLLIVAGMLQTGIFTRPGGSRLARWIETRLQVQCRGAAGILALGMLLALAFCPATAGMFFGVLIPFAVAQQQPALYALVFGLGCGLPLLATTACLAAGIRIAPIRRRLEKWPALSGWALIAIGVFLTGRLL